MPKPAIDKLDPNPWVCLASSLALIFWYLEHPSKLVAIATKIYENTKGKFWIIWHCRILACFRAFAMRSFSNEELLQVGSLAMRSFCNRKLWQWGNFAMQWEAFAERLIQWGAISWTYDSAQYFLQPHQSMSLSTVLPGNCQGILVTGLTICSLCILTFCNISYFPFWFWGLDFGFWLLQFLIFAYFSFYRLIWKTWGAWQSVIPGLHD